MDYFSIHSARHQTSTIFHIIRVPRLAKGTHGSGHISRGALEGRWPRVMHAGLHGVQGHFVG